MKINLENNFYILVDVSSYNLIRFNGEKLVEGKLVKNETTFGYHSSLAGAIKRYVRESLASKNETITLNEYVELYRSEVDRLERIAGGDK